MIRVLSLAVAVLLPLPAAAASASKCRLETSPQCSRGSVSTSRAGPAWCERYDGQVVQLGAGLPCITPEGLEAGAAATVVTVAGNRLDTWTAGNATVTRAPGGYWRIADESTSAQGIVSQGVTAGSIGEDHTFSCLARAGTTDRATLLIGVTSQTCQVTLPRDGRFRRVSCTHKLSSTVRTPALLVGWDASETGTIEVHGCQLEASAAPGRICYSGTCPADVHTYSAADWPRGEGSISVQVAGAVQPGTAQDVWVSGTASATIAAGILVTTGLGGQTVLTEALDWSAPSYRLTWEVADGTLTVKRDGTVIASGAFDGFPMSSTVTLGSGGLRLRALETVREADETIACVPVAGVGPGPVTPPVGFGWDPGLGITRDAAGNFSVGVDVSDFAPTGVTYYVGYPGGSDSNDGLTRETSFKTFAKARGMADVAVVMMNPGLYDRTTASLEGGTMGKNISIIGDGGVAIFSLHNRLTWALESGAVYKATRSSVLSVWDAAVTDGHGRYTRLASVGSIPEVAATKGSWFTDGTIIYVHTADGRPADDSIRAYVSLRAGRVEGGATLYVENVRFEGGQGFLARDAGTKFYAKNCSVAYSYLDGFASTGAFTHIQNCLSELNGMDGFNYHILGEALPSAIEVGTVGRENGWRETGSDNGSTGHDGMQQLVRVNSVYYSNRGPTVIDVGGSRSWNLGVVAMSSTLGSPGFQFDGELWCDGCRAWGAPTDLFVRGEGSVARLRSFHGRGARATEPGATIECY